MAAEPYVKQIWDTNSIFNPTRMNHIEDGIYDSATRAELLSKVNIQGTLAGDVITVLAGLPKASVTYFAQSNKPTNRPSGCDWGSYLIIKGNQYSTIIYCDNAHLAHVYAVADDSQAISWRVI